MNNRGIRRVTRLIHRLTSDEDKQQTLWLHYISGEPVENLQQKLEQITREQELFNKFQEAIVKLYSDPIPEELTNFLSNFSDFERSIMFLLLLGFTVNEVSEYKRISVVRIKQSISAIKKHTVWEKRYGSKEKFHR